MMETQGLAGCRIAFIGAGHMAEALIGGLLDRGGVLPARITASDVDAPRRARMREAFGINTCEDNGRAVGNADLCVLAVKPQHLPEALGMLRGSLDAARTLVLSVVAGKTTCWIEGRLGGRVRVVRAMPNTPALAGAGIAALCPGRHVTDGDMTVAETLLRTVGKAVRVKEEWMDAVTAVSGSGPAYVFMLIEAMEKAALDMGLPSRTARDLVVHTVAGAAALCDRTGTAPAELRRRVASKGGTTEAALAVLEERGIVEAVVEAVRAAQRRSLELRGEERG